jgi:hypothetical protein
MSVLRTVILSAMLGLSCLSPDALGKEISNERLSSYLPAGAQASVKKIEGRYFLHLTSSRKHFGSDFLAGTFKAEKPSYFELRREIFIPLTVEYAVDGGFGNFVQLVGNGDDDPVTGRFSAPKKDAKVKDLLSVYKGQTRNRGLILFSSSESRAQSDMGVELAEKNGGILLSIAVGPPIALGIGVEEKSFTLRLSTKGNLALVRYSVSRLETGFRDQLTRLLMKENFVPLVDVLDLDL